VRIRSIIMIVKYKLYRRRYLWLPKRVELGLSGLEVIKFNKLGNSALLITKLYSGLKNWIVWSLIDSERNYCESMSIVSETLAVTKVKISPSLKKIKMPRKTISDFTYLESSTSESLSGFSHFRNSEQRLWLLPGFHFPDVV
jgi:hypothetical protein